MDNHKEAADAWERSVNDATVQLDIETKKYGGFSPDEVGKKFADDMTQSMADAAKAIKGLVKALWKLYSPGTKFYYRRYERRGRHMPKKRRRA